MSRKEIDQHLFALQYELIFHRQSEQVSRRRLLRVAASFLERAHYDAVVEERSVNDLCGYPICAVALPPRAQRSSAKYRVAPRQGKVYASTAQHFCSESCAVASAFYAKQLSAVGVYVRELSQPLRVRLLDDPAEPADAWLADGPALRALFARIRLQRTRANNASESLLAPQPAAPAVAPVAAPVLLADVVREVSPEKRNTPSAPVIANRPMAIDGYVPKVSRSGAPPISGDNDDDDHIDDADLRHFLETGEESHRVEQDLDVDDDDENDNLFGEQLPSIGVDNYSDFVRLWLLFDIWRPDAALGAPPSEAETRPVDDSDVVPVADTEDAVLVTDIVTSQTGMRARALANLLRDALGELDRKTGGAASDELRRTALSTLNQVAHASQLRDAVPALTPRARAWLALVLLEARNVAWPNSAALELEAQRHSALVARAQEIL